MQFEQFDYRFYFTRFDLHLFYLDFLIFLASNRNHYACGFGSMISASVDDVRLIVKCVLLARNDSAAVCVSDFNAKKNKQKTHIRNTFY